MGVPRKAVQIAAAAGDFSVLFALADDGSVWLRSSRSTDMQWMPIPALPDAEACGAKPKNADDLPGCIYHKGHRDPQHYNRLRKWT